MTGEFSAVRAHPAVIVSVVIAAFTVAACALVAMAYMLGWVPLKAPGAPASTASPAPRITANAPGVALLPGETLVDNPDSPAAAPPVSSPAPVSSAPPPGMKPGPSTPSYAQRRADVAVPATPPPAIPPQVTRAQPAAPSAARVLPSRAAPSAPSYLREEPPQAPRSYERSIRGVCVNCGTVAAIGPYGGDWEVRVRFEDGSSQTMRYPERPALRIGEHVRLEDGRLLPD